MSLFTIAQIQELRKAYGSIDAIDPCGASYARLSAMLNKLDQPALRQLAEAQPRIKFVSLLAANRVRKMEGM